MMDGESTMSLALQACQPVLLGLWTQDLVPFCYVLMAPGPDFSISAASFALYTTYMYFSNTAFLRHGTQYIFYFAWN